MMLLQIDTEDSRSFVTDMFQDLATLSTALEMAKDSDELMFLRHLVPDKDMTEEYYLDPISVTCIGVAGSTMGKTNTGFFSPSVSISASSVS